MHTTYEQMHLYIHIYSHGCVFIYKWKHTCIHSDMSSYIHMYVHTYRHTHWYMSVYIQNYLHAYNTYVCIHSYLHVYVTGMLGDLSGLTKVVIYPQSAILFWMAVVLASLIPGLINAGWWTIWLAHKQLKITNWRHPSKPWAHMSEINK